MPPTPKAGLKFGTDAIRAVTRPVPVFRTAPAPEASAEFLARQVTRFIPHAETRQVGPAQAFFDGDRLVGFADPTTGQSHLVPLLDGLQGERSLKSPATSGARQLVSEQRALFQDESVKLSAPIQLRTRNVTRRGTRTEAQSVLATVKVQRTLNRLPVYGPGSAASATFSSNGLEGFTHRWSTAQQLADRVRPIATKALRDRLAEHVSDLAKTQAVTLHEAVPAYYDDGAGHVQPVYRYRVSTPSPDGVTSPAMYVGYVPIGEHLADLPELNPAVKVLPTAGEAGGIGSDPTVRVGRYVVREDNSGWVASANSFWSSLQTWLPFLPGANVTNAQYYWAEPRLFLADKDAFINSVHLALTEVHGNWNLFSTFKNYGDIVRLADVPSGGYGGADDAAHKLAYWILHSCEVIPTSTDEKTSYDVWWDIFNGLHAAMGYRTEMWINDQVTTLFGTLVGLGAPVVSSWLSTVIHDNDYHPSPQNTYYDSNRQLNEPMGRPSAIAVTGHGDDTLRMTAPLPRPSSLTEWWYDN